MNEMRSAVASVNLHNHNECFHAGIPSWHFSGNLYVFSNPRKISLEKISKSNIDFNSKTKIMASRQNIFMVKKGNELIRSNMHPNAQRPT
jgi:hypothetical protein